MSNLQEKLEKYYKEDYLPMHMPGHKRNVELLGEKLPYKIDITEIDGFDDLHHAEGLIKDIENKAKKIYGSKKSFLLVNGSTCGILAGIRSVVNFGDKVLVARNSHKSAYNAIELNGLNPIYILSKIGEDGIDRNIDIVEVEEKLKENKDIKLVIITSPNYEGVISNIKGVSNIAHKYNVPVLVDEAHGAHLKFMERIKDKEAINCSADIVVQSLHKTLPALTGTALLHIRGNLVKEENVARELSIFETSSPSYVLMSSIEECLDIIESKGKELFKEYQNNLEYFYNETKKLKNLKILGNEILNKNNKEEIKKEFYDFGKIVIKTNETNITGKDLANILRNDYKIELEMSSINYALAMTSICDSKENFKRLLDALIDIDSKLEKKYKKKEKLDITLQLPKKELSILETIKNTNSEFKTYKETEGRISKEYIWVYPPGIPLITPGEVISKELIKRIEEFRKANIEIRTTFNKFPKIEIIK